MAWSGEAKKVRAKTLAAIDRRCAGGKAGCSIGALRAAAGSEIQWRARAIFEEWKALSGAGLFSKLSADEYFDFLYCVAWCRAWKKSVAEYFEISKGNGAEAEPELELMAA